MNKVERRINMDVENKRGTLVVTIEGLEFIEAQTIMKPLGRYIGDFLEKETPKLIEEESKKTVDGLVLTMKDLGAVEEVVEEISKEPGLESIGTLLMEILEEAEKMKNK